MNKGMICVPVCAETEDELVDQIHRSEELADIIEVRFDCLRPDSLDAGVALSANGGFDKPLLATYRAPAEGGHGTASLDGRIKFWGGLPDGFAIADLEGDLAATELSHSQRINSFHDFVGVPEDIVQVYESISPNADVVKIVITANSITDAIPLWNLLERAAADSKEIIPLAMGEAGKWTRILGLAHGAFLTFGSLGSGSETAPGQLTARELRDLYRVKELSKDTSVYGVVAGDTSYSSSPLIQNTAFKHAGTDAVFVPLQVQNLDEFMRRMVKPETREVELNFHGFAVTNPHKKAVMAHLDVIDDTAQEIGAVNTVKIENGRFYGYNTDADGFIAPLTERFGELKDARVAVVGAGGAARACIYALQRSGAEVGLYARDLQNAGDLAAEFGVPLAELSADDTDFSGFDIIVNSTPLGTKGRLENETIAVAGQLQGMKLVYDLVYNPAETRLIREATVAGVDTIGGIEMLIAQGAKQFEIWTGNAPPVGEIRAAVLQRL